MQKNSLSIGIAGEYLACYCAIMQGYSAYRVSGQLSYDVVVENNNSLYKVQVKTSQHRDSDKHNLTFQLRRRTMQYQEKKSIGLAYDKKEIDLYAFVSPEYMKVAFYPMDKIVNKYKMNLKEEDFNKHNLKLCIEHLSK